jgi:hypothetical protein
MTAQSFHEILKKKMDSSNLTDEVSSAPSASYFVSDLQIPFINIPPTPVRKSMNSAYPITHRKNTQKAEPIPVAPPEIPEIPWIFKEKLDEDSQAKWNLFEKTIGIGFDGKITISVARSAFRKFLKSVHPDLTKEKSQLNFALLVKVKDEFIAALKKSKPANDGHQ